MDPGASAVGLVLQEQAVWRALAPYAEAARTLTPATAMAFQVLCRNVALEQRMATGPAAGGSDHRGMIQRVDNELGAFCLRPFGKPIYEAEAEAKPVNPLSKFLKRG